MLVCNTGHVHGWHGHVIDHRGMGNGGNAQEPVRHGTSPGGTGPLGGPRPPS